ncbi:DUF905 domain-containing protein [Klebsiella michiganensis]|uniref:DUF905 domain-containing protein n=1 Tax=Serratia marcescens TaxID=615 RepID=A0A9X8VFZ2_SERMA|nr:DUF905 domain-containing protein [Serratia marcescens]EKS6643695.1 DUF905 domain-containing protein [Enterobacter hormaechei]MBS3894758.1 DUF905 domain-containing protein [Serratia marcescens]
MPDADNLLLSDGPFTRRQAEAIVAAYQNVTIEDDQSTHFRLVLRDREGQLLWRVWNFEPDTGSWFNRYLLSHGIPKI